MYTKYERIFPNQSFIQDTTEFSASKSQQNEQTMDKVT